MGKNQKNNIRRDIAELRKELGLYEVKAKFIQELIARRSADCPHARKRLVRSDPLDKDYHECLDCGKYLP